MNTDLDLSPNAEETPLPDPLVDSARRGREAWRRLGLRLRSITPAGLARFLLVLGGLAVLVWLAWSTWPALAPFVIGSILAYILLPTVNWLDRYMPRMLAVVLAMLLAAAIAVLFVVLLVPVLVEESARLIRGLPSAEQLRAYVDQLTEYIRALPEPVPELVDTALQQIVTTVRENADLYAQEAGRFILSSVLGLVNTIGFVLGLIIVPGWMLIVLNDERKGPPALNRILPPWMQGDFWAVLRIVDRALRHFVQGQAVLSVFVVITTLLGLALLEFLGLPGIRYKLFLSILAGIMYLIPGLGPMLALIPAVLLGLLYSWETALGIFVVYFIIQQLVINFVGPRMERRIVDVHPAILFMVVVALGQLGFLWMFLAVPVSAIGRDLFQYAHGRLSEPPWPAGLLPGEPLSAAEIAPVDKQSQPAPDARP